MKKPIIYIGKNKTDILACCPNCDSNLDWTYETKIFDMPITKWKNGKRQICIHCGQKIDWSDYKGDIVY